MNLISTSWWKGRALRIYQPNAREFELAQLDVEKFIKQCADTEAEAVVISAGGIYAFYLSNVPYHYLSPVIGNRNLFGEIIKEAHKRELRVLARVDYSKAREDVWLAHPEWFQYGPDGEPYRSDSYYLTCPTAGYQNEEFAFQVIRELLTEYKVDGFHLNAGGFFKYCYCDSCRKGFGEVIPTGSEESPAQWKRFLRWRYETIGRQFERHYAYMQRIKEDVFFMAEMPGVEHTDWRRNFAWHLPAMANSASQQLLTSGGVGQARESRWWVAVSSDQATAINTKPIINVKMSMREMGLTETFMPMAEFRFNAYQALAHGAGLKLATFGLPHNIQDARVLPGVAEVFAFMRRQSYVLDSMETLSSVVLVWPEQALLQGNALQGKGNKELRGEFMGFYAALKANHIPVSVQYDEQLAIRDLGQYEVIVLPTAVWLSEEQAEALLRFVEEGGRLVVLDSPKADSSGQFLEMPRLWRERLGGKWSKEAGTGNYTLVERESAPGSLMDMGPIPLLHPYRRVKGIPSADVWLYNTHSDDQALPEEFGLIQRGEEPIVMAMGVGKGTFVYAATGFGLMFADMGHTDYLRVIEALIYGKSNKQRSLITDAPETVEVTPARWSGGLVVHIVNATGVAPLSETVHVGSFHVSLQVQSCRSVQWCVPERKNEELPYAMEDGWVKFEIPRLASYGQAVIYF